MIGLICTIVPVAVRRTASLRRSGDDGAPAARASVGRYERPIAFALVGGFVMLVGYLVLFSLVDLIALSPHLAFVLTMLITIELNFSLSECLTWRDRRISARGIRTRRWLRFHALRWSTVPFNQALFSLLVIARVHYLVANTVCIACSALLNYALTDRWVFRRSEAAAAMPAPRQARPLAGLPARACSSRSSASSER